jgi:hypothetical protein
LQGIYGGVTYAVTLAAVYRSCYFGLYDVTKGMANRWRCDSTSRSTLFKLANAQLSAILSSVAVYPFDVARRRLQMQNDVAPEMRTYRGMGDVLRRTYAEEGIMRGLYAGFSVNAVRSIGSAIVLAGYEALQERMESGG